MGLLYQSRLCFIIPRGGRLCQEKGKENGAHTRLVNTVRSGWRHIPSGTEGQDCRSLVRYYITAMAICQEDLPLKAPTKKAAGCRPKKRRCGQPLSRSPLRISLLSGVKRDDTVSIAKWKRNVKRKKKKARRNPASGCMFSALPKASSCPARALQSLTSHGRDSQLAVVIRYHRSVASRLLYTVSLKKSILFEKNFWE